jgi:hypothetical protein
VREGNDWLHQRRSWFAFTLLAASGCGLSAHYADSVPPRPPPTGCSVTVQDVRVKSNEGAMVSTSRAAVAVKKGADDPAADFAIGLPNVDALDTAPPRTTRDETGLRRVGDVRSGDREVDVPVYEAALCGWTASFRGTGLLTAVLGDCKTLALPTFHELSEDLRREAAERGADVVDGVRCYGENLGKRRRIWCEGTAQVTSTCSAVRTTSGHRHGVSRSVTAPSASAAQRAKATSAWPISTMRAPWVSTPTTRPTREGGERTASAP